MLPATIAVLTVRAVAAFMTSNIADAECRRIDAEADVGIGNREARVRLRTDIVEIDGRRRRGVQPVAVGRKSVDG